MNNNIIKSSAENSQLVTWLAFMYSASIILVGYFALGWLTAVIFSVGFIGGWLLWLKVPNPINPKNITTVFVLTLIAFLIHKYEERTQGFFPALSQITGVPVPTKDSVWAIAMNLLASPWLIIPIMLKWNNRIGSYFTWTFFVSMGITELAHFVFPFLTNKDYSYFPGMYSVIILAPLAWRGIYLITRPKTNTDEITI